MDGITLLREIRSRGDSTPVIIMTGYASMQSAISALQFGADDYLIKPIAEGDSIVRATRNAIDRQNLRLQNAMLRGQLHESELSFKTVFDQTADMIFIFPLDQGGQPACFEQCNRQAADALGHSEGALHGMTIMDLLARSHRRQASIALTDRKYGHPIDAVFVRSDGKQIPTELRYHKISTQHQTRIIAIARNISERVEIETRFANTLEDERAQLGRELHDVVCQDIASIQMLAGPGANEDDIKQIRSASASAIDSARSLSRGLVPVFEDSEDFRTAVEELLRKHKERHGVDSSFAMDCPLKVGGDNGALHLFRILQEATSNTVKHGGTRRISVDIESNDGLSSLTVKDDGECRASGKSNGMGTLIMNQRARILGASLSISHDDNGTTVRCCW
jgi:PAS domain S-box-containing protein